MGCSRCKTKITVLHVEKYKHREFFINIDNNKKSSKQTIGSRGHFHKNTYPSIRLTTKIPPCS